MAVLSDTAVSHLLLVWSIKTDLFLYAGLLKKGAKGHFCEETHNQLLEQLMQIISKNKTVVILGDGEFDKTDFLLKIKKNNFFFVARTAQNRIVIEDKVSFQIHDLDVVNYDCF